MMEFTAAYLNFVQRELERQPGKVEDLRVLTEFLEKKEILGLVDYSRMVDVPGHVLKIVEVPEDTKA